jgi:hypothetical protein
MARINSSLVSLRSGIVPVNGLVNSGICVPPIDFDSFYGGKPAAIYLAPSSSTVQMVIGWVASALQN